MGWAEQWRSAGVGIGVRHHPCPKAGSWRLWYDCHDCHFLCDSNRIAGQRIQDSSAKEQKPQHNDYNSVFWFNVIAGLILYIVLFFSAPFIADFYHKPELVTLCRYVFLGFVFSGWGMAQSAYLTKNLKIKEVAKSTTIATLASCVIGVVMAYCRCSYWSLATQSLTLILFNTLLLWYYSPWRPSMLFRSFRRTQ